MPTRPATPDPAGATSAGQANPYAGLGASLGAGLDFFQDWLKAAGSALPNVPGQAASAQAPGLAAWTMPTLDPAELDKRIQDLKTVQFWLEQNARMVAMTIQGLEVQRMTLSTLRGMNVSMDALRDSLKARAPSPSSAPQDEGTPTSDDAPTAARSAAEGDGEAPDLINPIRWWDTLTQQFTHLASQAAQTVGESMGESMEVAMKAAQQASAQTPAKPPKADAAAKKAAPRKKANASGTRGTTGKSRPAQS
jgi:hypothetical protein